LKAPVCTELWITPGAQPTFSMTSISPLFGQLPYF